MKLLKYVALAALFAGSVNANATLYEFKYTFNSGDWSVSGIFDGTATGDLIAISELKMLAATGPGGGGNLRFDQPIDFVPLASGSFASFSGNNQNFYVATDFIRNASSLQVDANGSQITSNFFAKMFPAEQRVDAVINTSWSVIALAVPEPASYGMMLAGLGLIGVVALRRKQS